MECVETDVPAKSGRLGRNGWGKLDRHRRKQLPRVCLGLFSPQDFPLEAGANVTVTPRLDSEMLDYLVLKGCSCCPHRSYFNQEQEIRYGSPPVPARCYPTGKVAGSKGRAR